MRPTYLLCVLILTALPPQLPAQANQPQQAVEQRDGSHDFDPLVGTWKYHLKRRLHPLTGSNQWVEFDGTGECRNLFGGAQIDQGEWNGPTGRIVGLTLRVYNPTSHQWRLY